MKPGNWFEVLAADTANMFIAGERFRHNVKYELQSTDRDGNKNYKLTFERTRLVYTIPNNTILGYDSYYPAFRQGLAHEAVKPTFYAKVDKIGKILSIISKEKAEYPKLEATEIAQRKEYGGISVMVDGLNIVRATKISEPIFTALAKGDDNWYSGHLNKYSGFSYTLNAASFPLSDNVVVEGKILNNNDQIRKGLGMFIQGIVNNVQINNDGSFKMTGHIAEGAGAGLYCKYEKEGRKYAMNIPLYLQPGDSLTISADRHDILNTMKFSGNAVKKAMYGLALAKMEQQKKTIEIPHGATTFSAENYAKDQQLDKAAFDQITRTFHNQIPKAVLEYHNIKFTFEQAKERLDFLSKTHFKSTPENTEIFEKFPNQFFSAIDTLPVLMIDYNAASWYDSFLNSYGVYQSFKTAKLNGGSNGFFLGDYVLSLNYLRRYPLYRALAEGFEDELGESNWRTAQTLNPYYYDFMKNCGDTLLTKALAEKWRILSTLAPGKYFPLKSIQLADGKTLDFSKYKGKATSVTFNFHYPDKAKFLLERIKKQDASKVQFIVVNIKELDDPKSTIADEFKKLSNVTYVEVNRDDQNIEDFLLMSNFDIKTFVLDDEHRIVEDNINDSPNNLPQDELFEKSIERALAPKKMGKAQKAELIKTIGWSVGSILFASMIFFWIYKARISTIKRKEALKRQIKELEIKAIRSQMNPHFIFNALNSIQSLINTKQYKQANIYLEKFSLLMRSVLNNSEKVFVSLSDELKAVTLYTELEKLRFDFAFEISIDDDINADLTEIPGMISQPLIENAILHGIARKGSAGLLQVTITKDGRYLRIAVADNGAGWKEKDETQKGFGLKLVEERLNLLNTNDVQGKLEINHSMEAHSGVVAILTIPID